MLRARLGASVRVRRRDICAGSPAATCVKTHLLCRCVNSVRPSFKGWYSGDAAWLRGTLLVVGVVVHLRDRCVRVVTYTSVTLSPCDRDGLGAEGCLSGQFEKLGAGS